MSRYNKVERYASWWKLEIILYRGDDIIAQGTIKEVAEQLGVRKDTVYWYTTGAGYRRAARVKDQSKARRAVVVS